MCSGLRPRPDVTCLVRIFGDREQEERWRAAARLVGFHPVECQDEDGHPVMAVWLRDRTQVAHLVELLVREKVSGSIESIG